MSVGLEFFFAGSREKPLVAIVRKRHRVQLPDRPGAAAAFHFASLEYPATERRFNCYYAEFLNMEPEQLRPHHHPGVEFIYTIQRALSVHMDSIEHKLDAGDSMYFDSTVPHAYRRSGNRACSAVVVTSV